MDSNNKPRTCTDLHGLGNVAEFGRDGRVVSRSETTEDTMEMVGITPMDVNRSRKYIDILDMGSANSSFYRQVASFYSALRLPYKTAVQFYNNVLRCVEENKKQVGSVKVLLKKMEKDLERLEVLENDGE